MIIDKAFQMDYVDKGTPHNGIDTNAPGFKPFYEVQYLHNGQSFIGNKEECVNWMTDFYIEHFYEESCKVIKDVQEAEINAEKLAYEFITEKVNAL